MLTRTTRAVVPTEAGERLLSGIGPHFEEIDAQIDALSELRDKPAGSIRITASDHAINHVLWPKLRKFLPNYPDIKVELVRDNGLTDIVTERFDAGVRMGEQLAKDMISARISPDFRFAVVGAKSYFKSKPEPLHPQELVRHICINERLPTLGGFWSWEFEEKGGREIKIRVDGQVAFNNCYNVLEAAIDGFGLAYVPEEVALPHIAKGRLKRVLEDWSPILGWLLSLLPEPTPIVAGFRCAGRCAASPRLMDAWMIEIRSQRPATFAAGRIKDARASVSVFAAAAAGRD